MHVFFTNIETVFKDNIYVLYKQGVWGTQIVQPDPTNDLQYLGVDCRPCNVFCMVGVGAMCVWSLSD